LKVGDFVDKEDTSVDGENTNTNQTSPRWFIDLDWHQQSNCSFFALAHFITGQLPILESIFRLFLANGNQPLDLEELGRQLSEWRGGDTYRTSAEILSRLLASDQYYGLRQINK
jgi:hypothetical protein